MNRIIINGANGYVASNFIHQLLRNDFEVIALVRENAKTTAAERMQEALCQIENGQPRQNGKLKVFDYALQETNFGLSDNQLREIFGQQADYFHFAASLKYDKKSKEELQNINVKGVENSIKTFAKFAPAPSRFFFMGTAYSCGNIKEVFREKFYPDQNIDQFRNYYEWSKRLAENIVKKHIDNNGLNAHIIRLSQVSGNNLTAETLTDYGIFDFAKRVNNLAKRYPRKTIRAKISPDGTQNLIPINAVIDYLMQAVVKQNLPIIMNFVANTPVKNRYILNSLAKLLPLHIVPAPDLNPAEMNPLERLMAVGMSFTGNYTSVNIKFDTTQRDEVLSPVNDCMDEQTVYRMLDYFIENGCEKERVTSKLPIEN